MTVYNYLLVLPGQQHAGAVSGKMMIMMTKTIKMMNKMMMMMMMIIIITTDNIAI